MSAEQFFTPRLCVTPTDKEQNVIRILTPRPLEFLEIFVKRRGEDGEPQLRDDGTVKVVPLRKLASDGELIVPDINKGRATDYPKKVQAYLIWNYSQKRLQIFSVTQHSIKQAIEALSIEAELAGKTIADFDMTIIKSGDGSMTNTSYNIEVDRTRQKMVFTPLDASVQEFYSHCKNSGFVKGFLLLRNEYPFLGDAAEPMPKDISRAMGLIGGGVTVEMLKTETDPTIAKMLFRELAKKAHENVDTQGYIADTEGTLHSIDELKQIRDEIITPF